MILIAAVVTAKVNTRCNGICISRQVLSLAIAPRLGSEASDVMTARKQSPSHDKWHRRVEGQIRDCITQHPKWFKFVDDWDKRTCINSLAKRIVGEILTDQALRVNDTNSRAKPLCTKPKKVVSKLRPIDAELKGRYYRHNG